MKFTLTIINILCFIIPGNIHAETDTLDKAISESVQSIEDSSKSQQTVDKLADTARDMLQDYRNILQQVDSLEAYNNQLEKIIASQSETKSSISRQLKSVEEIQRNFVPLMLRMVSVLDEFIRLDMPFLLDERMTRLETIKSMMNRADVSLPDKFRRIMEAYQIEMGYGRTIGTSSESIQIENKQFTVNILQIGRVALLYQSLDGNQCGYWDKHTRSWKSLPKEYLSSIAQGILIADKKSPPDLFRVPIPSPGITQ